MGHLGGIDPVDGNFAAVDLIEAHQQVDQRSFAGAGAAHDRDLLARLCRKADILHQDLLGVIAKADMFKGDVAFGALQNLRLRRVGNFLGLVQQLEGSVGRSQRRLQGVDHVGRLGQRLRRLVDVLEEGLNDTDGHGAV